MDSDKDGFIKVRPLAAAPVCARTLALDPSAAPAICIDAALWH
jgi:hypothetical protein|eukprot:COSAG06_NODE_1670_length_8750_cov_3.198821_7_plen_43_part_00